MGERGSIAALPAAADHLGEIRRRLDDRRVAVFLDYDGTLTPIVDDPADATLPDATRRAVVHLAERCTVAVVSGRDLDDVRAMVDVDGIHYAGSHGFDIRTADGRAMQRGREFLPSLEAAAAELEGRLAETVPGARVERKRFAVAVHFRQVDDADVPAVREAVDAALARHDDLRRTGGKRIYELRPDLPWDKGRALEFLVEVLGLDRDATAVVFVGDDVTDEDAFRAIGPHGVGLVVRGEDDDRPTAADYRLADPTETRGFLEQLAAMLEDGV